MKKTIGVAFLLLAGCLGVSMGKTAQAATFQYEVIDASAKTARITKVTEPESKVTIPAEVNGYKIIEVGIFQKVALRRNTVVDETKGHVFDESDRKRIVELVLPEAVKKIGNNAFAECKSMSKVIFPKNITDIGSSAFAEDGALTEVKLGAKLMSIGSYAFTRCTQLKKLAIQSSRVRIGEFAFGAMIDGDKRANSSLISISLPNKFYGQLMEECFNSYMGTEFTWPEFLGKKESEAFLKRALNLRMIRFPKGIKKIYIPADSLWTEAKVKKLVIPEGVKLAKLERQNYPLDRLIVKGKKTVINTQEKNIDHEIPAAEMIAPDDSKAAAYAKKCVFYAEQTEEWPYQDSDQNTYDINFVGISVPSQPKVKQKNRKLMLGKRKKCYEIFYKSSKNGSYKKAKTTKKKSVTWRKKGYVKVRVVRKTYGETWHGEWSNVLDIK